MSKTNSRPSSPIYSTIGPDFEALNTTSSRPSSRRASPKLRSKSPKPRSKSPKLSSILKPSTRPSSPYSVSTILSTAVSDLARIEAENSTNWENQRQISKSLGDLTSNLESLHDNQIENLKSVIENQETIISNQKVLRTGQQFLANQIESNFDQLWSRLSEIIHKQERITADFNQFEKFKRRK